MERLLSPPSLLIFKYEIPSSIDVNLTEQRVDRLEDEGALINWGPYAIAYPAPANRQACVEQRRVMKSGAGAHRGQMVLPFINGRDKGAQESGTRGDVYMVRNQRCRSENGERRLGTCTCRVLAGWAMGHSW
jgi:hypothetical protein